jgi:hypothetical protein
MQGDEGASDADRLAGEGGAEQIVAGGRRVALGVHEVDGGEDGAEPLGERVGVGIR